MIRSSLPTALACLALFGMPLSAADLTRIDRKIAKEPTYRSNPKYCLLVFGADAHKRTWLVLDGDTLYVDRNGNGDLTEEGEKVAAEKREGRDDGTYAFQAGDVRDGALLHKDLRVDVISLTHMADRGEFVKALVTKDAKARGYLVSLDVEMPGRRGTGVGGRVRQQTFYLDVNGVLQLADRPQEAPIIHFGGPLQVTLFGRQTLMIDREVDMILGVGTPGIGPGTTAYIDYEDVIPQRAYPTVEVTCPPKEPGEPPVRRRYELKQRC
jgi:hypothetical protein